MERSAALFDEFWDLTQAVWSDGVFGVDIGQWLIALVIILAALVVRRIFTRLVIARIRAMTRRTETEIDDRILAALEQPIRFIPVVFGIFIAVEYLQIRDASGGLADNLIRSLIAFTIFWGLYRLVAPLSFLFDGMRAVVGGPLVEWLLKALKGLFIFLGGAAILEIWGIDVGALLAGLGLFGVAVALGAQDLFKNLIAGILILAEKRFRDGHWILVDGIVEGTVEKIGFRSTLIRRFDLAPVYVPNTELADNAVTNFSLMTHRRIYWTIGVEYRSSVDQLKAIRDGIEVYIRGNPDFMQPHEVPTFVRIDAFGESAIDILVYCFTRTRDWGEWLRLKEAFAYQIKDLVEGAGTGFAFPSRSIYIETPGSDAPEPFALPGGAEEKAG